MNACIDISKKTLETKDLLLRPFAEDDLLDFYAYASIQGVGEAAGWKHHESLEESKKILDFFIKEKKVFAIVDKLTHKVIGSLGIEKYKEELLPELSMLKGREIGCVLAKDYWGRGLMPSAVARVISYLFSEEQLDFIVYSHFEENIRSKRVCEKNHFRFIKPFISQTSLGVKKPSYLYILYKEDWANEKI